MNGPGTMKTAVVLDANALLMPFQFGINLDAELRRLVGECEMLVPSSVLEELDNAKPADLARAAKALASRCRVVAVDEKGDEAVIATALRKKAMVVTNDRALIGELKKRRVPVICLRSRSHLVLIGNYL